MIWSHNGVIGNKDVKIPFYVGSDRVLNLRRDVTSASEYCEKFLLMPTCIVKLLTEQKRTVSTATWSIMTGCRTAAAEDRQKTRKCLGKQKCLNLYSWQSQLTFNLIWYPAHQRLIDKFSSIGSGSYYVIRTNICAR